VLLITKFSSFPVVLVVLIIMIFWARDALISFS
jgi:hypothetical protein